MFFQDIYVDYLNPKFHDDGIVIVASRACQRGPILPRERVLGLKIMFLDPKEVSKPKMALIEVVGHIMIDFRTKLQVVWSMYVVFGQISTSRIDIWTFFWIPDYIH